MDTPSASHFTLAPGSAQTLPHTALGAALRVRRGRLWVTGSGVGADTPGDHFVHGGEQLQLPRRGTVVIECDGSEPAHWQLVPATG